MQAQVCIGVERDTCTRTRSVLERRFRLYQCFMSTCSDCNVKFAGILHGHCRQNVNNTSFACYNLSPRMLQNNVTVFHKLIVNAWAEMKQRNGTAISRNVQLRQTKLIMADTMCYEI